MKSILILMSVMVPLQLKFIEGKMYSMWLVVAGSSALLDPGPYMLTVSLGRNPRAHSIKSTMRQGEDMCSTACGRYCCSPHAGAAPPPSFSQQTGRKGRVRCACMDISCPIFVAALKHVEQYLRNTNVCTYVYCTVRSNNSPRALDYFEH